jgi:hypothetical protein
MSRITVEPVTRYEVSLDGVVVGEATTRQGAVQLVYQALASFAQELATLQPIDAQHYRKAARYLTSSPITITILDDDIYLIRRTGGSEHMVTLNTWPVRSGIQRHGCTCANPKYCWARALAEALDMWHIYQQAESEVAA